MKPTIEYIEKRFKHFNEQAFAGRLPMPPVKLFDASKLLGQCHFRERTLPDGSRRRYNFSLRFNTRMDFSEELLDDVILHEMIHYFIGLHNLPDPTPHGPIFKSLMKTMNEAYGRNMSISTRLSPHESKQLVSTRRSWHVIAVISMKTGATGVKVLPRVMPSIIRYYRQVSSLREVRSVHLYLHDNPFFNRYPTSSALRIHEADAAELTHNLAGARELTVKGSQVLNKE